MLGNQRLDGCANTTPSLTNNRDWSATMAMATDATNPHALKPRSGEAALMRRMAAKVDTTPGHGPNGDCHLWTGRHDGHGYGEIKIGGRYKKVHRLALFGLADIDNPLLACHHCDTPLCVKFGHLFAGRPIDNVADMIAKGRRSKHYPKGGRPRRKLTDDQVREIRSTKISNRQGALRYGVSRFTINQVRRGLLYRSVE